MPPMQARRVLGAIGGLLLVGAAAVTILRPDGTIVAAFTGGGVLLIVLAASPSAPTKVSVGSTTSVEWSAEQLVETAYNEQMLDLEGRGSVTAPDWEPPTIEDAKDRAREATTPEQLLGALRIAQGVAVRQVEEMRREWEADGEGKGQGPAIG